nr:unnamed protein product [Spirometra erinaceieuropaei]
MSPEVSCSGELEKVIAKKDTIQAAHDTESLYHVSAQLPITQRIEIKMNQGKSRGAPPSLITPHEPEKPERKKLFGIGHWNRYTRGNEYLSLTPESRPIGEDELVMHNSPENMWMALSHNGKVGVYDVTKFAEYHPGGFDLIAMNAGTDASEEFRRDFFTCRVVISRRLDNSIYRHLRLLCPADEVGIRVPLFHHIFVRVFDADGEPHIRPYTPCCVEFEPMARQEIEPPANSLDLLVKVYELGCVSTMLDKLQPVQPPRPTMSIVCSTAWWDWKTISSSTVTIEISLGLGELRSPLPATHCLAVCSQTNGASLLTLRVLRNHDYYLLKLRLLPIFRPDLKSLALDSSSEPLSTNRAVEGLASSSSLPTLSDGSCLLDPRLTVNLRLTSNTDEQSRRQQFSTLGAVLEDRLLEVPEVSTGEVKDFFTCRVVISRRLDNSIYRHLRLLCPADEVGIRVPLFHHIFVRVFDADGEPHIRPYTPCCVEFEPMARQENEPPANSLDLLVKVYELGCVSTMLDKLQPDDSLQVSLPVGKMFPSVLSGSPGDHEDSSKPWRHIYMLAAGSGITPFLRVLLYYSQLSLLDKKDAAAAAAVPKLRLLWFNRTLPDIVLGEELSQLVSRLQPRLTVQHILSEEDDAGDQRRPNIISGRLTEDLMRSIIDREQHSRLPDATLWMICGPPGFNTAAVRILETLKEYSNNVHVLQA